MQTSKSITELLDFILSVYKLKDTVRTGWTLRGVNNTKVEKVSDHSFGIALLAFLTENLYTLSLDDSTKIDKVKVLKMALIHDIAESVIGDIPPESVSGFPKEKKHEIEMQAMKELTDSIGEKGVEIMNLFEELENRQSAESKIVNDLDKLEMLIQALKYKTEFKSLDLSDFYKNTAEPANTNLAKLRQEAESRYYSLDSVSSASGSDISSK